MSQETQCTCVHIDAETCARIRDGIEDPVYKRKCECVCHQQTEDEQDESPARY